MLLSKKHHPKRWWWRWPWSLHQSLMLGNYCSETVQVFWSVCRIGPLFSCNPVLNNPVEHFNTYKSLNTHLLERQSFWLRHHYVYLTHGSISLHISAHAYKLTTRWWRGMSRIAEAWYINKTVWLMEQHHQHHRHTNINKNSRPESMSILRLQRDPIFSQAFR